MKLTDRERKHVEVILRREIPEGYYPVQNYSYRSAKEAIARYIERISKRRLRDAYREIEADLRRENAHP